MGSTKNLTVIKISANDILTLLPNQSVNTIMFIHPVPEVLLGVLEALKKSNHRVLRPGWKIIIKPHMQLDQ